jgi:hypothetical protein
MRKVSIVLPSWIGEEEAQEAMLRDLRARSLLKLEFYRSKMKRFESKYAMTFPDFQRQVEQAAEENFEAWDDLIEWESYYRGYQEWQERHAELQQWSGT